MLPWILCAAGLAVLLVAGDLLVRGAVNLSLRAGIPALIVSLTIVAFGTSAPELLISVQSVLTDRPGLALGNVVGSNTANVLLVLGIPAIIAALATSGHDSRRSYVVMLAATVLFIALCLRGQLDLLAGLVLLAALVAVLWDQARSALKHRRAARHSGAAEEGEEGVEDEAPEGADPDLPMWRMVLYLVLGLAGLPLGAHLLVENASVIARQFGISEAVIGLTLVAVGTSLPELATTVMAAIRRQADVALGNVIGSNYFNLLGIMGTAALFGTIPVEASFVRFDLWVMLAASLAMIPFVFLRRDITRVWGLVLTALYGLYVAAVLI